MTMPGYKRFIADQILEADTLNDYIMDQAVIVARTEAGRNSALTGTLREGMVNYLKADETLRFYDGASWVRIATYDEVSAQYNPRNNQIAHTMEPIDMPYSSAM